MDSIPSLDLFQFEPTRSPIDFDDTVLLSKEHQLQLDEWLGRPRKGTKIKCVYRSSADGPLARDFHRCCDNVKTPTLVVIKTTDGQLIGGFTNLEWTPTWTTKKKHDDRIFLFVLSPSQFSVRSCSFIECASWQGPVFGNDLVLCDDFRRPENHSRLSANPPPSPARQSTNFNNGNSCYQPPSSFSVENMEVFSVSSPQVLGPDDLTSLETRLQQKIEQATQASKETDRKIREDLKKLCQETVEKETQLLESRMLTSTINQISDLRSQLDALRSEFYTHRDFVDEQLRQVEARVNSSCRQEMQTLIDQTRNWVTSEIKTSISQLETSSAILQSNQDQQINDAKIIKTSLEELQTRTNLLERKIQQRLQNSSIEDRIAAMEKEIFGLKPGVSSQQVGSSPHSAVNLQSNLASSSFASSIQFTPSRNLTVRIGMICRDSFADHLASFLKDTNSEMGTNSSISTQILKSVDEVPGMKNQCEVFLFCKCFSGTRIDYSEVRDELAGVVRNSRHVILLSAVFKFSKDDVANIANFLDPRSIDFPSGLFLDNPSQRRYCLFAVTHNGNAIHVNEHNKRQLKNLLQILSASPF